ncbi:MAG: DeoR/GlpR transcriptional regulator [Spirochaetales bacterium]|nr:DeoR/GlpR transcriptional regulator [Spirochaetales bacterium]
MDQEFRKKHILEEIERNGRVSLQELVKRFQLSEMTVRRDLTELERQGFLIRKYGGAVKTEAVDTLFSFNRRVERNSDQKEAVCRTASQFIYDGDIIFIDCGTTLFRLARFIKNKRIRVITNSLPVVSELLNDPQIRLSFVGGDIDSDRQASYGRIAEKIISEFKADKAFIGMDGVSLSNGLSSFDEKEGMITKTMAEHAGKVYLLCDSSKIEKDSYFRFAPISLIDILITDSEMNSQLVGLYKEKGVEIISHA